MSIGPGDLEALVRPLSAYGKSTNGPLSVSLDTGPHGGRTVLEVWVKSDVAAEFVIYGSSDGQSWRRTETISLAQAGEAYWGGFSAWRHVRVATEAIGNHEIEIAAAR